jgi:hypothetical protein
MRLNRVILGVLLGFACGLVDVLLTLRHPERTTSMLLQAFFSRFALGFLGANVSLRMNPIMTGALVGLLVSLPDAIGMKSYVGVIGSGLVFGALVGLAVRVWAKP